MDHSVVQELLDLGEIDLTEAATHPERHVLTRALGTGDPPEPEYWLLPAGLHDRLLICTDGLTRELGDEDLAQVLAGSATRRTLRPTWSGSRSSTARGTT